MEDTSYMTHRVQDKYFCTFKNCDKKYIHKRQAEDHYYTHHLNQPQYFCQLCDKTFSFRESLQSHNKLVHNGSTEHSVIAPATANRSPHGNCQTTIRVGEVPSRPPLRPAGNGPPHKNGHERSSNGHSQSQPPQLHSSNSDVAINNPVLGRPRGPSSMSTSQIIPSTSNGSYPNIVNGHSPARLVGRVTASGAGHQITWASPSDFLVPLNGHHRNKNHIISNIKMDLGDSDDYTDDIDDEMEYFEDPLEDEEEDFEDGLPDEVYDEKEARRCNCSCGLFLSAQLLNKHHQSVCLSKGPSNGAGNGAPSEVASVS